MSEYIQDEVITKANLVYLNKNTNTCFLNQIKHVNG